MYTCNGAVNLCERERFGQCDHCDAQPKLRLVKHTTCAHCNGNGVIVLANRQSTCHECEGVGYFTVKGEQ